MLTPTTLPPIQQALAASGLDGWLVFDFHGLNPVAAGLLGLQGMATRRIFALIPREGRPVAITHVIEEGPWRDWPAEWGRERYSSWRALEAALAKLVRGKRVAMEYSPGDAVPYLDRVPAGVLEMVRAAGAEVVTSAELVTRFYAALNARQLASHERAAEQIATIARDAFTLAAGRARSGEPITEHELRAWIGERFDRAGLLTIHGPIVAAGANAANPHYEPDAAHPHPIVDGELLLIDLWAREKDGVFADQTWMASLGAPGARAVDVWRAVRDARDAAIALLRQRVAAGAPVRGGELDDAARWVITERGFGDYFPHRTGHSIDARDLHGSGPHIDNLESREERLLIPGVAFSIEPGVYIPGEIGVRSEVNAHVGQDSVTVTPAEYQTELLVV
ncbi:MAG TPA: Xaa-Pro peptidase family protein [Gemmatimonadaceae bacterium]|nr:Xaa-Pro peptidase family protein [Gemmatimonadaceae bacterium]